MYKIEIFENNERMKALIVDGELACFYTVRDNGDFSITRADEGSESFIFLESMLDLDLFKYKAHFYASHINNLYELVEEGEVVA